MTGKSRIVEIPEFSIHRASILSPLPIDPLQKTVIREIKVVNGEWVFSEIIPNLGGLESTGIGHHVEGYSGNLTDISSIEYLHESGDFVIGGFTTADQIGVAHAGNFSGADNGYLARITKEGDLVWIAGYGPTDNVENLFDFEICHNKIVAAYESGDEFFLQFYDLETGRDYASQTAIQRSSNSGYRDFYNEVYVLSQDQIMMAPLEA